MMFTILILNVALFLGLVGSVVDTQRQNLVEAIIIVTVGAITIAIIMMFIIVELVMIKDARMKRVMTILILRGKKLRNVELVTGQMNTVVPKV